MTFELFWITWPNCGLIYSPVRCLPIIPFQDSNICFDKSIVSIIDHFPCTQNEKKKWTHYKLICFEVFPCKKVGDHIRLYGTEDTYLMSAYDFTLQSYIHRSSPWIRQNNNLSALLFPLFIPFTPYQPSDASSSVLPASPPPSFSPYIRRWVALSPHSDICYVKSPPDKLPYLSSAPQTSKSALASWRDGEAPPGSWRRLQSTRCSPGIKYPFR